MPSMSSGGETTLLAAGAQARLILPAAQIDAPTPLSAFRVKYARLAHVIFFPFDKNF